jgi:hypothetical protein
VSVVIVTGVRAVGNTFDHLVVTEDQTLFLCTILGMYGIPFEQAFMLMSGESDVAIHIWRPCLLQDTAGRTRIDTTDAHGIVGGNNV